MLKIMRLERKYCDELAVILSTDYRLHKFLSENEEMIEISRDRYYEGCIDWQLKKRGYCFCIMLDGIPIGSISYVHKDFETASVGMWISSNYWNKGFGTYILKEFMEIVKNKGYKFIVVTIQKKNLRSKRMCEKYGSIFKSDRNKWYIKIRIE